MTFHSFDLDLNEALSADEFAGPLCERGTERGRESECVSLVTARRSPTFPPTLASILSSSAPSVCARSLNSLPSVSFFLSFFLLRSLLCHAPSSHSLSIPAFAEERTPVDDT